MKATSSGKKTKINTRMSTSSEHGKQERIRPSSATSYRNEVQIDIGATGPIIRSKPQRRVSQKARDFLRAYQNRLQAEQALDVLERIDKILENFGDLDLPEIHVTPLAPDGTLGLVWDVADGSLGISIDVDPEQSRWFLLIGPQNKALTAFGRLGKLDIDKLLKTVVNLLDKIPRSKSTHAR